MKTKLFSLTAVVILLLAACTPAAATVTDDKNMGTVETVVEEKPTDAMLDEKPTDDKSAATDDDMSDDMSDDSQDSTQTDEAAMMESPAWFETEFVNVNNGETFRIADLKGKVILVETMATWCSNCLKQQKQVKALHEMLGDMNADLVSVGVGIDINENAEMLKSYVQKQGFDWYYTIATAGVANEIGNLYGTQFLNPPSTPILLIDRSGEVHVLPFGIKDAASLKDAVLPLLEEKI